MNSFDSEEKIGRLLKETHKPVQIPQDFKERLRTQLVSNSISGQVPSGRPLWGRPGIVIPAVASVSGGLIGYGAWVSWHLASAVLP